VKRYTEYGWNQPIDKADYFVAYRENHASAHQKMKQFEEHFILPETAP
jgi:hypothetical protein